VGDGAGDSAGGSRASIVNKERRKKAGGSGTSIVNKERRKKRTEGAGGE
jgi:hypothetical protein